MQKFLSTKSKTLLPKDKAKDLQFFKLLETNQPAFLGPLDRKRLKQIMNCAVKNQKKVEIL